LNSLLTTPKKITKTFSIEFPQPRDLLLSSSKPYFILLIKSTDKFLINEKRSQFLIRHSELSKTSSTIWLNLNRLKTTIFLSTLIYLTKSVNWCPKVPLPQLHKLSSSCMKATSWSQTRIWSISGEVLILEILILERKAIMIW